MNSMLRVLIDRFHSRGQQLGKFFGTKESCYVKKDFNPLRIFWYTNMTTVTS